MNRHRYNANTAAFQGAKQWNRREALASIAVLGLVSSSFAAHAASVIAEAPSPMADLIQKHREAELAWSDSYDQLDEAKFRLTDSLKADPIECRLIGCDNPTWPIQDIGEFAANVVHGHTADAIRSLLKRRAAVGVDEFPAALSEILANETENFASVAAGNGALRERQAACGVIDAEAAEKVASELEKVAFVRLLSFRPTTMDEVEDRLHYLMTETVFQHTIPSEQQIDLLFGSMMTRRADA